MIQQLRLFCVKLCMPSQQTVQLACLLPLSPNTQVLPLFVLHGFVVQNVCILCVLCIVIPLEHGICMICIITVHFEDLSDVQLRYVTVLSYCGVWGCLR